MGLFAWCCSPIGSLATGCKSVNQDKDFDPNQGTFATKGVSVDDHSGFPLKVQSQPGDFNNLSWSFPGGVDWSNFNAIVLGFKNESDSQIKVGIRIDDDPHASGNAHNISGVIQLNAGETKSVSAPMVESIGVMSVGGGKGQRETMPMTHRGTFDSHHIYRFQIFVVHAGSPINYVVQGIHFGVGSTSLRGLVDKYGQNSRVDYKNKVSSDEDLRAQKQNERLLPAPESWDSYGGDKNAQRQEATGKFRIGTYQGKPTFIDPDGYPFYEMAMDSVRPLGETSYSGREHVFAPGTQPTKDSKGNAIVDHYRSNLAVKYGSNFEPTFLQYSLDRLKSWGFNTLGEAFDTRYAKMNFPFVDTNISVRYKHWINAGSNSTGVPDPFDPDFRSMVHLRIGNVQYRTRTPYCLGITFDNEMAWAGFKGPGRYALAYRTLALDANSSPAKAFFVQQLKSKYGDISSLNNAWGASVGSWDALNGPVKVSGSTDNDLGGDMSAFVTTAAEAYFKVVADEIHSQDPGRLYLGCRFASYSPEVIAAAAKYCDALSFNIYAPTLDTDEYAFLRSCGKPVIITEFHFGATDRGGLGAGLVDAGSQVGRARMYEAYTRSCLNNPNIIGYQYYEYHDQPITGRPGDGENFAMGFLSITDTPYDEIIGAAQEVNRNAYQIRFGNGSKLKQVAHKKPKRRKHFNAKA